MQARATADMTAVGGGTERMNDPTDSHARFVARGRLVLLLIAALLAIQGVRSVLPPDADARFLLTFSFVPASFTRLFDPTGVALRAGQLVRQDMATPDDIVLLLGLGGLRWWTPLTYALLHGGWTHVLVNSVWLAAFGSAVARRFGGVRFLLFFAVTAVGGVFVHYAVHARDFAPLVGASAAVSGAMAAAARFAFAPGAPLGPGAHRGTLAAYQGPPLRLRYLFHDPRVATFLLAWCAANLIFGIFVTPGGLGGASIAWEAHIGGFLTGLLLFDAFDPSRSGSGWSARPVASLSGDVGQQ